MLVTEAKKYAAKGWSVFPVKKKIPTTPHGFKDAVNIPEAVEALFKKYPGDGIALATGKVSGVFVLDVDIKNDAGGDDTLRELEHKHGELPETVQSKTASGGSHYFFKYPESGIGSNASIVGKGLDVRGDGGYVVAPPSPGYAWEVSHHPDDITFAKAPEWLLEAARRTKKAQDLSKPEEMITSDRNQTLTKIAGNLRRNGLEADALYDALSGVNQRRCDPPLDEQEVRKIASSVARYKPTLPAGAYTDQWAAELFKAKYGDNLHWCDPLGGWLIWDGTRWLQDDTLKIERMAYDVIKQMHDQANASDDKKLRSFAVKREQDSQFRAMISRLRALDGIPARSGDFDQDTHKINAMNHTIDLKSGLTYAHHRPDMITRRIEVTYNPEATCPRWMQFLGEIFSGDLDLIDYVQRAIGYSLSGDVSEHCLFVLYGMGRNGKSTFLKHIAAIMGDYAQAASAGLLIEKRNEGIPNDVARLRGTRLVVVQESKRGNSFDESQVKALTGGDRITARFLRKEFFEFNPTFKIWFSTNHKPDIIGTDVGIWRRIRTIPFERVFTDTEADKHLDDKLRAEYEGIFAWMVQGYHLWQKHGLGENKTITAAGEEYQEESDIMKAFIDERCEMTGIVAKAELRTAFLEWRKAAGVRFLSKVEMYQYLSKKIGLKDSRFSEGDRARIWVGISLNSKWTNTRVSGQNYDSVDENEVLGRSF
jgi:putative DNA primase/helicase